MGTKINYSIENLRTLEVTGGCTEYSVGCQNCWARKEVWRMAHNPLLGDKWQGLVKKTPQGLRWTGKIKLFEDALQIPLKRNKPTTYFVDSKADLFHPKVPYDLEWPTKFLTKIWATMLLCPQHTFLVLTKRIERAQKIFAQIWPDSRQLPAFQQRISQYLWEKNGHLTIPTETGLNREQLEILIKFDKGELWPIPNVHLGATICNQDEMWKADLLTEIPTAVQFISFEPLLGDVEILPTWLYYKGTKQRVVVGCESGPKRRPCKLEWIRSIIQQCKAAGAGCYVKQMEINGKVEHDMSKFPEWARVRETI